MRGVVLAWARFACLGWAHTQERLPAGVYGGYAALEGVVRTPDLYRCAVSVAGVSDIPMMLADVAALSGAHSVSSDWWRMLIGDRHDDRDHLSDISPSYRAADVHAPILLIHGTNDIVASIAQSRRMASRLRAAHKDVRLVEFPGEDHWLCDAQTRIQMLREIETFLGAHLGWSAPAAAAPAVH